MSNIQYLFCVMDNLKDMCSIGCIMLCAICILCFIYFVLGCQMDFKFLDKIKGYFILLFAFCLTVCIFVPDRLQRAYMEQVNQEKLKLQEQVTQMEYVITKYNLERQLEEIRQR